MRGRGVQAGVVSKSCKKQTQDGGDKAGDHCCDCCEKDRSGWSTDRRSHRGDEACPDHPRKERCDEHPEELVIGLLGDEGNFFRCVSHVRRGWCRDPQRALPPTRCGSLGLHLAVRGTRNETLRQHEPRPLTRSRRAGLAHPQFRGDINFDNRKAVGHAKPGAERQPVL
jgi:hypothetical protein